MKTAAAEAQWTACQPCSFSLFHIGGGNDHTPTQIGIEATDVRPASPITTAPAARRPSATLIDKRAHLT
jgi:hypothetical protein